MIITGFIRNTDVNQIVTQVFVYYVVFKILWNSNSL